MSVGHADRRQRVGYPGSRGRAWGTVEEVDLAASGRDAKELVLLVRVY